MNIRYVILLLVSAISLFADVKKAAESQMLIFLIPAPGERLCYAISFMRTSSPEHVAVFYALNWYPVGGGMRPLASMPFTTTRDNYESVAGYLMRNSSKLSPQPAGKGYDGNITIGIGDKNSQISSYVISADLSKEEGQELWGLIQGQNLKKLYDGYKDKYEKLWPEYREMLQDRIAKDFAEDERKSRGPLSRE
jgi:hypothetical protein